MAIAKGERTSGFQLDAYSAAFMPASPGRPGESGPLWKTPSPKLERKSNDTSVERVIAGGSEYRGVPPDPNISAAFMPASPGRPGESGQLYPPSFVRSKRAEPVKPGEVFHGTTQIVLDIGTIPALGELGQALIAQMPATPVGRDAGVRDLSIPVVYLAGSDPVNGVVTEGFTGKETVRLLKSGITTNLRLRTAA